MHQQHDDLHGHQQHDDLHGHQQPRYGRGLYHQIHHALAQQLSLNKTLRLLAHENLEYESHRDQVLQTLSQSRSIVQSKALLKRMHLADMRSPATPVMIGLCAANPNSVLNLNPWHLDRYKALIQAPTQLPEVLVNLVCGYEALEPLEFALQRRSINFISELKSPAEKLELEENMRFGVPDMVLLAGNSTLEHRQRVAQFFQQGGYSVLDQQPEYAQRRRVMPNSPSTSAWELQLQWNDQHESKSRYSDEQWYRYTLAQLEANSSPNFPRIRDAHASTTANTMSDGASGDGLSSHSSASCVLNATPTIPTEFTAPSLSVPSQPQPTQSTQSQHHGSLWKEIR